MTKFPHHTSSQLHLLKTMSRDIQNAKYFSIMVNESADLANEEQLLICFGWVDEDFKIHEDFIGFYPLPNTRADSIVKVILYVIHRMGLKFKIQEVNVITVQVQCQVQNGQLAPR